MKDTITIADYLAESEIWPYSRKHFELLRECGELTLLETYIEAENYIVENAGSLTDETLGLLIVEAGNRPSTADKLADRLSSSAAIATKLAEKKCSVGIQVFELLRTISRANVTLWSEAAIRFVGKRKDKITALNAEAGKLLEQGVNLGADKLNLPAKLGVKYNGIELVRATFDRDTVGLRKFNDTLKDYLSDADFRMLKSNEGWLAPKLTVQAPKVLGVMDELMTETERIVSAVCDMQTDSPACLDIVKSVDILSAKIGGIKADSTITFWNADALRQKCKTIKTADDKLTDHINNFIKNIKSDNTVTKKINADNGDQRVTYGAVFTALSSLITELHWATKTVIKSGKLVLDRIDNAAEFQKQVLFQVREKIKQ
jgi:hypothetical protein